MMLDEAVPRATERLHHANTRRRPLPPAAQDGRLEHCVHALSMRFAVSGLSYQMGSSTASTSAELISAIGRVPMCGNT